MHNAAELEVELDAFVERIRRRWAAVGGRIERISLPVAAPTPLAAALDDVLRSGGATAAIVEVIHAGDDLAPLRSAIAGAGLDSSLVGWAPRTGGPRRALAVVPSPSLPASSAAPASFRVQAIMCAYNEVDIVRPSVERLLGQGIDVHVIDNWSFDGTGDALSAIGERSADGGGTLTVERFPEGGRPENYEWTSLLEHVAEVAAASDHDWCVHHDVDQRRESPFPGQSYVDFLWLVERWGFNAVDHTLLEFRPTDDDFIDGTEPSDHLRHFEFMSSSATGTHIQAWRNTGSHVDLTASGGHEAAFADRQVFPLNATLRHYPVRGQRHGDLKVFRDRKPRYVVSEMDRGWHWHYARLRQGHNFVRDPGELIAWDDDGFLEDHFVPRLSQRGIWLPPDALPSDRRRTLLRLMRRTGFLPRYVQARNRINRLRARR